MGMRRRRRESQESLFVMSDRLPRSEGHVFYTRLNELLSESGFDRFVEDECQPYYAAGKGRLSIPPGVYFRMLLVGYFEGIGSQRGIAWRCADSLSLRQFLGLQITESSPDHSSLTRIRDRLPVEVHESVFRFVLKLTQEKGLLRGRTVAIDSTTLEANAAMKSIVRRDTGEDWKSFVTGLMRAEGVIAEDEEPSDEEARRFDKKRKNKKVSNKDWVSKSDPDARIARMKDGRTHLCYKAEHVVDLESDVIVAAEIYDGDYSDTQTMADSLVEASMNLQEAGGEAIEEAVADKGYHAAEQLELVQSLGIRTYVPSPKRPHNNVWTNKSPELKSAVYSNRRRLKTAKNKRMQRKRSEIVERTFAHVYETGGARRSWLRGKEKVKKRTLISALTKNLSVLMRSLFGIGTPRGLQADFNGQRDLSALLYFACLHIQATVSRCWNLWAANLSTQILLPRIRTGSLTTKLTQQTH